MYSVYLDVQSKQDPWDYTNYLMHTVLLTCIPKLITLPSYAHPKTHHTSITCTSHAHAYHMDITCTSQNSSHFHHMHIPKLITCTSHAHPKTHHTSITCTSHAHHITCISHAHPQHTFHVIRFSDLIDLWVIKIKKPMILCAHSTE